MTYSNLLLLLPSILVPTKKSGTSKAALAPEPLDPLESILAQHSQLIETLVREFHAAAPSPTAAFDLERRLQAKARDLCRDVTSYAYNRLEGDDPDALPSHAHFDGEEYRIVRQKSRRAVDTLFGPIALMRHLYRPVHRHSPEASVAPLELSLGLIAYATPALAEAAARALASTGSTQRSVQERLKAEHGVTVGVKRLRELSSRVAESMGEVREEMQAAQIVAALAEAEKSRGKNRPALVVGRDGVTLRKLAKDRFEVASVATVTVQDRKGKRLRTVYLAAAPESGQGRLSNGLTQLLVEVLRLWQGPLPRLAYVTDSGDNETKYYRDVLRTMVHPLTGKPLKWQRIVDFYHAMERIWKMAVGLFGADTREGQGWARRMGKLLKRPNGPFRVLHSAAALEGKRGVPANRKQEYRKAYEYLRKRTQWMQYDSYKRLGLPLGSGLTEAACKTVYSQRLKLSGMRWTNEGAQVILDLRVMLMSGIWDGAYRSVLHTYAEHEVEVCGSASEIPTEMAC